MISNNEMVRIRRQMQRRIQDVVAERRRTRLMEPPTRDRAGDPTESGGGSALSRTA
ncbi:hypothetical protein QTQ03_14080 [Micromonospora sp. WMMA1363]|uniref:hypothetical protein n=1 Tax=Micromonospora sp. WMMA1363 TaxID=3053985 RepID=UPI00259CAC20|nr:hypothetical protein [Micromonospora sp. WMMA1363]MDM4720657.1 hypothetical protein [Micromonospora sp. WMMA1363]